MSAERPRAASHWMRRTSKRCTSIRHRNKEACGGRYLSEEDRAELNRPLRVKREFEERMPREGRKIPRSFRPDGEVKGPVSELAL